MATLFNSAWVQKSNTLNELRCNNMTLQELRFFSIYLSRINQNDISTRVVKFTVEDFRKIMGFSKLNIKQLRASTDALLCKIVHVPEEGRKGFRSRQLFKECGVYQDDDGVWYVEIDAHDKVLPLMFELKNSYFSYELWNALRLNSTNQLRMYEILQQWLNKKESITKEFEVGELRSLLGVSENAYVGRTGWSDFRKYVLDSCQKALKEVTDLCYTYERGKTGRGGKWLTVVFHIKRNTTYKSPLTLEQFIEKQSCAEAVDVIEDIDYGSELGNLLGDAALGNEFSVDKVRVIQDLVLKALPHHEHIELCNYLIGMVHRMNTYQPKNRFGYLCKMIENDIKNGVVLVEDENKSESYMDDFSDLINQF